MARPLRIEYDGAVYHITSRGNERKPIYKEDEDRSTFLDVLHRANTRYNWLCHAYCLMNNHYHLIIETPDGNLSHGMRQLNGVYTQLFNKRHNRVGHIFQGRYKAILIQKESHLLEASRYVVLNPVRAKAVKNLDRWKWSSYRGTAGKDRPHPCLTKDWILGQFGSKRRQSEKKYREFVMAGIGEEKIWKDVKGQSIFGEDEFIERFLNHVKGYEEVIKIEIERARRHKVPLSLVMSDIDHFKKINNTHGHNTGDYVLKTLAQIVKNTFRKIDYLVRWGGEEFLIIAPDTNLRGAEVLSEKIRKAIENYHFNKIGQITISCGVTQYKKDDTEDTLIKRADDALYKAKEKGRNRVEVAL